MPEPFKVDIKRAAMHCYACSALMHHYHSNVYACDNPDCGLFKKQFNASFPQATLERAPEPMTVDRLMRLTEAVRPVTRQYARIYISATNYWNVVREIGGNKAVRVNGATVGPMDDLSDHEVCFGFVVNASKEDQNA